VSVTISYDLANFIMYTLGAVLIIVAVITLLNVNRFVKRLDKLVEKNEENFNKTANTFLKLRKT